MEAVPLVEAGDAGATPLVNSVRARLNSDGFIDLEEEEQRQAELAQSMATLSLSQALPSESGPKIEMASRVEIHDDYILTSYLGDWAKLYQEGSFGLEQSKWDLRTELPLVHRQICEAI